MSQKQVTITLNETEIRQELEKALTCCPHKKLVADTIIGTLSETTIGLTLVTQALLGRPRTLQYKEGDRVLVKIDRLYYWSMNRDNTRKRLCQQDYLPATISDVKTYGAYPYHLEIEYINDNGEKKTASVVELAEGIPIIPRDEFPLNL